MSREIRKSTNRMRSRFRRAFTVIELMIAVAVIFVLVTTAMVALRAARRGADRTQTLSALRQMITGYSVYYGDHNGRLLPGYIAPNMFGTSPNQLNIKAELKTGYRLNNDDAGSYVWRLAPYVDHKWEIFMADYSSAAIMARFEDEYGTGNGGSGEAYGAGTASNTQIGIAKHPSIGLNSAFAGGDSFHGGNLWTGFNPWKNLPAPNPATHAVTHFGKAKNPAKFIVFAPTQASDQPAALNVSETLGYCELRAPFRTIDVASGAPLTSTRQWYVEGAAGPDQGKIVADPGFVGPGGFPVDRHGENKIATAHLDASVSTENLEDIGPSTANPLGINMSRWNPNVLNVD